MDIFSLFSQYSLSALFVCVLIEQMGVPIPALPLLVLAGVTAAGDAVFAVESLAVATGAAMLADSMWFYAGRRFGRRVLGLLCRISISPDTCVRQSELSCARRGVATLVVAKFIPGMSLLTSPMAGALGMRFGTFVLFNLAGTMLWAGGGICFGLLFHAQARQLLGHLLALGSTAMLIVAAFVAAYLVYRFWRRWRVRVALANVPRMAPGELFELMEQGRDLVILDVRAAMPGLPLPEYVPGARRIELTEIDSITLDTWSPDARIIVYCACPNDASALKAAHLLIKRGRAISVLQGGVDGWVSAGYALEMPQP